jgi:hypothetical protein
MKGISPEDYPKDKKPISARAARVRRIKRITTKGLCMLGFLPGWAANP